MLTVATMGGEFYGYCSWPRQEFLVQFFRLDGLASAIAIFKRSMLGLCWNLIAGLNLILLGAKTFLRDYHRDQRFV